MPSNHNREKIVSNNSLQDLLTQVVMPFGGDSNLKKYANEKSPLRSELYSTEQLEQYASTLANSHLLSTGLMSDTLINRLEENRAMLEEVHQLLIKSAREGQLISPAGEWLLDNYYLISEQITRAKKHFPKGYSKSLPRLAKGPSAGFPRVYDMAIELISHSDGRIDFKSLLGFVKAYQHVKTLKIGELWAIPIMLRLALLENLRRLSTQLAIDRHHVNIADYWADLMTSTAEKDPKSLIVVTADMAKSDPPMVSSFVAELSRRLNGKGPALALPLTWIEQRLSENGLTSQGLVHADTQKQAAQQVSMSNSIGSLRFLNSTNWREFVEATSAVEHILREDIDGIYEKMDFHTRDHYRHVVEKIAKNSDLSEEEIARMAISHSAENAGDSKKSHVGYYLIKQGRRLLERESGMKISTIQKFKLMLVKYPFPFYSASMIIFSLLLSGLLVMRNLADGVEWHWTLIIAFVSFIATSFLSVTFINWLITLLTDPYFFARMDFSDEIPDSARTMVVVPTIFKNINDFDGLVESMEVRFLANRKDNLLYALLTDFADADAESFPEESPLLLEASKRIEALNQKYGRESNDIFFLFHRPRIWNAKEGKWMGYERKRGKLSDLNNLILGKSAEHFNVIVGEKEAYQQVKYIITLDRDTQLPRDAAWKMVATIAHPLNKATFDTEHHRISEGYGILQPRVSTSLPDAEASWYQRLHSNEEGIDPYTRAVSDVYQDLLEEGSFIGKGIYDVAAFELALGDRLPENRILSHDLVEGCHARSGLISDVELYEEYPGQYLVDMSRRHRWIRGDWQIARWLFPKVPIAGNRKEKNPLSSLSRWKILDNLRRSFIAPCLLILLLFGWTISISPWFWTVTVVGIIIPTSILSFFWSLLAKPKDLSFAQQLNNAVSNLVNQGIQHSFLVVTLPYEAYLDIDAMIRTGWRMLISRKNLLQWDPFDGKKRTGLTAHFVKMWIAPALATIVLFILLEHSKAALFVASPVLVAWFISPLAAWIMSLPQTPILVRLSTRENIFLKKLARKTWGFFEYFVGAEDHFLPPDNYQEQPAAKLAHRTSPTNIGLYLLSNLSAYDFGYLPASRFIERAKSTFDTLSSLQRFRGHFYNWYDTITLQALTPKYISTVDSGNLAGHLLTLKEGILELKNQPIVQPNLFQGIKDTANVLAEKLKDNALLKSFQVDIASACLESPQTLSSVKLLLQDWTIISANLYQSVAENSEFMTKWWANALQDQCAEALKDL
ncbi:MAG: cyclic beta 1-2 glucan synthetase, partial [Saprospiraceae bacterium]